MKLTHYSVIAILASSFLVSCSKDDDKSYSASYDYTQNQCPTGKHTFTGSSDADVKEKLCTALADDDLNNNCAVGMRMSRFEEDCKGTQAYAKLNGSGTDTLTSAPAGEPKPDFSEQISDDQLDKTLFQLSLASGDQRWTTQDLELVIETSTADMIGVTRIQTRCSTQTPIILNGNYPRLQFSIGRITCDDRQARDAISKLQLVANDLEYIIRRVPVDNPADQFSLSMDTTPIGYRFNSGYRVVRDSMTPFGAINALVNSERVFLDLIVHSKAPYSGKTAKDYLEVVLTPRNGRLSKIKVELVSESEGVKTNLVLSGNFR